ncbi:MAG: 4-amino-4-deoxy-L-arabinose transferase-like glycosyltransferase [Candidatus Latescibacterota bacterium]|jgi:4-amino-4-deoxy-L-arabinose transferase-like glycosyltransferase
MTLPKLHRATYALLALILLSGLTLRFVAGAYAPPRSEWADAEAYHALAKNIYEGNGYTASNGESYTPTRYTTPTYPIFIAIIYTIFGADYHWVLFVQRILGALSVLLVFMLALRFFGEKTALCAAAIAACYPALIYYTNLMLRESLTGVFVLCIITLIWIPQYISHKKRLVALGFLLAISSMCRPETLLLTAPIYLILKHHPIRPFKNHLPSVLCIALPILVVWVPWTTRNYIQFGSLSPVTTGLGSVLWFGNRWAAIGGDSHQATDRQQLKTVTATIKAESAKTESAIDKVFFKKALNDLVQKPLWFAEMTYKKGILFWKDANGVKKTLPKIHPALPTLLNTYYYSLLILALGAVICYRQRKEIVALFGLIIFYMMIYALLHVRNRYRVPILPIVFILSAGGIQAIGQYLQSAWQKHLAMERSNTSSVKEGPTQ